MTIMVTIMGIITTTIMTTTTAMIFIVIILACIPTIRSIIIRTGPIRMTA